MMQRKAQRGPDSDDELVQWLRGDYDEQMDEHQEAQAAQAAHEEPKKAEAARG